ncbi:MAG: hypothetical protein RR891_02545 [Clostridium sp.]
MEDKYKEALKEVMCNLRMIEGPNPADEFIDDAIKIIKDVLEEEQI